MFYPLENIMTNTLSEAWAQIVAKAAKDETFKELVIANPKDVLAKFGFEAAQDKQYKVLVEKNKLQLQEISMPVDSSSKKISADELKAIAGGRAGSIAG